MYLLLADDLTGGGDAGIQFASRGLHTRLALSPEHLPAPGAPEVLALNTGSRNIPGPEAASRVARAIAALKAAPGFTRPGAVFKKIDSTLRGNIGPETDALMDGLGFASAFLTPAYPAQGRVVRNGELFVNGVPVHEAGFGDDPVTPVREAGLANVLKGRTTRRMGSVPLDVVSRGEAAIAARVSELAAQGVELFLFDAENQAQLEAIAAAGVRMADKPLFIGAAGLAAALAGLLSGAEKTRSAAEAAAPPLRVLFVCGSAHKASRAQVAHLASLGLSVVFYAGDKEAEAGETLAQELRRGDAVLTYPLAGIDSAVDGMVLSEALGEIARNALTRLDMAPFALALVMTGGETAHAVLRPVCSGLTLERELLPGVVLCSVADGGWQGLRVVTKAGGFGAPDALARCAHLLRA